MIINIWNIWSKRIMLFNNKGSNIDDIYSTYVIKYWYTNTYNICNIFVNTVNMQYICITQIYSLI